MDRDMWGGQDWRRPEDYAAKGQGLRAMAWQCVSRDQDFLKAVVSAKPAYIEVVRNSPAILVVTPLDESALAPWGLHFRAERRLADGGGLCRMARRLRS